MSEIDRLLKRGAFGEDPAGWDRLSIDGIFKLFVAKSLQCGEDPRYIAPLRAFYRYVVQRVDVSVRAEILDFVAEQVGETKGLAHSLLNVFITDDEEPSIISTAALVFSELYPLADGENIEAGPRHLVDFLLQRECPPEHRGYGIGGVLLLGDKRFLPLVIGAWRKLSEEARLAMTLPRSGIVTEGVIEFWLWCMETDCSDSVLGSVVAAICRMPVIAQTPFVYDIERVMPAYEDPEQPVRMLRRTPFVEYLKEIRPRLEAIEEAESEPKLIPAIYEVWHEPEKFRDLVG